MQLELFLSNLEGTILNTDIVVNSPNQAILIAKQFFESNEYDLFRGQSGLWTVVSHLIRSNETEQKKTLEKYEFIDSWLQEKLNIDEKTGQGLIKAIYNNQIPNIKITF